MRIHVLKHVPFEGPGSIADWAAGRGYALETTELGLGETLPEPDSFDMLVVLGGPMGADQEDIYPWLAAEKHLIARAVAAEQRVLGICLGAQIVAAALGARVYPNAQPEIGWFPVDLTQAATHHAITRGLPPQLTVLHWHNDTFDLPVGAVRLGSSAGCLNQGFLFGQRAMALQFHLEATPATVAAMIEHEGAELVPGPLVENAAALLAPTAPFTASAAAMHRVLDNLCGAGGNETTEKIAVY